MTLSMGQSREGESGGPQKEEQKQEDQSYLMESSVLITSASWSWSLPASLLWTRCGSRRGASTDMMGQDCVFAQSYEDICVRQMYPGTVPGQRTRWAQNRDMCEDRQSVHDVPG